MTHDTHTRFSIRIPNKLLADVKRQAERVERSTNWLICKLLEKGLSHNLT